MCGNARLQTLQPALQICRVGFARSEADRLVKEGSTVEFMKDSLTHGGAKPPAKRSEDLLGPNSEIGRKLKQYYDGNSGSSDVPDRFAELLSELEAAEAARGKRAEPMEDEKPSFKRELLSTLPSLRAFAVSLSGIATTRPTTSCRTPS